MKVKASNIARVLADIDLILADVSEITIMPGKVKTVVVEDGFSLIREYGVDSDA